MQVPLKTDLQSEDRLVKFLSNHMCDLLNAKHQCGYAELPTDLLRKIESPFFAGFAQIHATTSPYLDIIMRKNKKKLHPWFPAKPKVNGDNTKLAISANANNASSSIDDAKGEPVSRLDWADETLSDPEREKRLARAAAYLAANREKYQAAFAKAEQHFVEPADGILAGPRPRRKPTKYLKAQKKND